jgi:hypothetical protein
MIWNVEGADAHTGAERVVSVVADSEQEAERLASGQGLLVSAVFESTIAAARPFDGARAVLPVATIEPMPAAPAPMPAGAVPTVPYKGLYTKSPAAFRRQRFKLKLQPWRWRWTWERAPYFHLRLASRVLGVLAVLSYVSGVIAALLGVISFFRRLDFSGNSLGTLYDLFALSSPLILGALLHAAAAACDALRDIALASLPRARDVSVEES